MKSIQEIEAIAKKLENRINDLEEQKSASAAKGNWKVVQGIKEEIKPLQTKYDTLVWVLSTD